MHTIGRYIGLCALVTAAGCGQSIHDAVASEDIQAVREMIEANPQGCDSRNELGKTPLHYAVNFAKQPDIVAYLIEAGCPLDAQDATGMTPLHVAAFIDLPGAAKMLVRAGASLEPRDEFGDTPLHTAAMQGARRVARVLLRAGANPALRNDEGLTPLDLATRHRREETAAILRNAVGASS